jgi:hypothetical protein
MLEQQTMEPTPDFDSPRYPRRRQGSLAGGLFQVAVLILLLTVCSHPSVRDWAAMSLGILTPVTIKPLHLPEPKLPFSKKQGPASGAKTHIT